MERRTARGDDQDVRQCVYPRQLKASLQVVLVATGNGPKGN